MTFLPSRGEVGSQRTRLEERSWIIPLGLFQANIFANCHQGEPKGTKSRVICSGHSRFGVLLTSLASLQGTESGLFRR